MSSEISIEPSGRLPPAPPTAGASMSEPVRDEGFRPWHFFVLASILLATVAVILARQSSPEHLVLLSFTIAAAGAAAAAFYRTVVPLVAPSLLRTAEPVNERTRTTLERDKALVLRSIKELEFDRAMGKVSQKDFDEMAARLRARAMLLMKQLDQATAGYARTIENDLRSRLATTVPNGSRSGERGQAADTTGACSSCSTTNDSDAVFCKKCGTRLHA